jgi:hypothetical protein
MLTTENFVQARVAMAQRLALRRAERFGRPIHGDADDEAEMTIPVDDPSAPPIAFHLIYQDAHNALTGRCFTLRTLKDEIAEVRLSGICHLRDGFRTFLASRTVEVTDLATGEVSEDGLEYFRHYPMLQHLTGDSFATLSPSNLAVQSCRDEIILLTFLAASDEDFCKAEEDQIVGYVLDYACDPDVSEPEVRRRIRDYIPDEQAFDRALARMCRGEGDATALLRAMRRLVEADGEIDSQEIAFVEDIQARLVAAGRA